MGGDKKSEEIPRPILNKADTVQNSQAIKHPRPTNANETLLMKGMEAFPFPADFSDQRVKSSNSISFQVPSHAVKHRGSISTRPSTTNLPQSSGSKLHLQTELSPRASRQSSGNGQVSQPQSAGEYFKAGPQPHLESRANSVSSVHSGISVASTHSPVMFELPSKEASQTSLVAKKKPVPKQLVSSLNEPAVPFTQYLQKEDDQKIHILIAATGSVATIKVPLIIDKLFKVYKEKVSIQLVLTRAAEHFLNGQKISSEVKIWRDNDEWSNLPNGWQLGDPMLNLELRRWADIFLIAPLSANSLAKMANGLADNLLSTIVRSWNPSLPILAAPAMNTLMYTHPMTRKHLGILAEDFKHITVLKPVEKVLMCGDIGMGGMREWSDVVEILVKKVKEIRAAKTKEREEGEKIQGDAEEDEDDEDDDEEYDDDDDDDDYDDEDDDDDDDDDDEPEEQIPPEKKSFIVQHHKSHTEQPPRTHSTTDLIFEPEL